METATYPDTSSKLEYRAWMRRVNDSLMERACLVAADLPDWPWRDHFDEGTDPRDAAYDFLCDMGFDLESRRCDGLRRDPETIVIENGFLIDQDTGEILGHVEKDDRFHVTDLGSAEWVLERMQESDARIMTVRMRRAAIEEQMDAMEREECRRRDWLDKRFRAELETFVRDELDGKKARSFKTPFGTVGFRKQDGSIKVLDRQAAIAWAKKCMPAAVVQREEIVVTPLKGLEDSLPPDVFDVRKAADSFYVDTKMKGRG